MHANSMASLSAAAPYLGVTYLQYWRDLASSFSSLDNYNKDIFAQNYQLKWLV